MQRCLYIVIFLLSFFEVGFIFAQDSEQILNQKASKLFDTENFVSATPFYLQLLALQPRNPEYNYKYGACLLHNSTNRKDAFKYLDFATSSKDVNADAYYFMGKAFHLNYQFEKAISFYQEYQVKSKGKINKAWELDRQIQSCKNGKQLLKNVSDIVVFEKKSALETSFYSEYDLSEIGGDILISDTDQSKVDKKKAHRPLIYFPPNAKRVFFGSYGNSETTGKDIYVKNRNSDGSWSKPELVQGAVNSEYDEDYPFMDVKNGYLYFSSKGHNSMGGFDIFKSKYDAISNSFGAPENLDFAISSTDNDLMYIKDDSEEFAWFASARHSKDGRVDVYKVKLERVAAPIAAIHGTFNSIIHPENKKLSIEVKDLSSNKIIGTYYTDDQGNYLISFPKSGKYEYSLNVFGTLKPFTEVVDIPYSNEMILLKQKLVHSEKSNREIVEVVNMDSSNDLEILAEIMSSKAELNPNIEFFDFEKPTNSPEIEALLVELNMDEFSAVEALSQTLELIDFHQKVHVKNENLQQKAFQFITENNLEISSLQLEVKNSVAKTHGTMEETKKSKLLNQASEYIERINILEQKNKMLIVFSDSIQRAIAATTSSLTELNSLESNFKNAQAMDDIAIFEELKSKVSLIQKLQVQKKELNKSTVQNEITSLSLTNQKNMDMIRLHESNVKSLEYEIQVLENNKAISKAKKIEELQTEIDIKTNELEEVQSQISNLKDKNVQLSKQLGFKNDQLTLIQQVEAKPKPTVNRSISSIEKEMKLIDNQNFRTLKSYVVQQKETVNSSDEVETLNSDEISNVDTKLEAVFESELEYDRGLVDKQQESDSLETDEPELMKQASVKQVVTNQQVTEQELSEQKVIVSYQSEIAKIESNSKLSKQEKIQAIVKVEKDLQKNLDIALAKAQMDFSKNPGNETTMELYEAFLQEKENSMNRVSEQSQILVVEELERIDADKLLSKLDPSFVKDVQKIEKSKSETMSDELIERENQVQKQLKEKIELNLKTLNPSNSVKLLAENLIINNLIEASEERVKSLRNSDEKDLGNQRKYVAQKDAFRTLTLEDKTRFVADDFNTVSELNDQKYTIENYQAILNNRLDVLSEQTKTNSSNELQSDVDWTINELKITELKLAEVSEKLIEINKDILSTQTDEKEVVSNDVEEIENQNSKEERSDIEEQVKNENNDNDEFVPQKEPFQSSVLRGKANLLRGDFNSEPELIQQQKAVVDYRDVLEKQLIEYQSQTKTNFSLALQNDIKAASAELEIVDVKLKAINQKLKTIVEDKIRSNEIELVEELQDAIAESSNDNNNTINNEYIAQKGEFRAVFFAGNELYLRDDLSLEPELVQQQETIKEYQDILNKRLEKLRSQVKTKSSPAVQSDLKWTIDELDMVEVKLSDIASKLFIVNSEKELSTQEIEENIEFETALMEDQGGVKINENLAENTPNEVREVAKNIEYIQDLIADNKQNTSALKEESTKSTVFQLNIIDLENEKIAQETAQISMIKDEKLKSKILLKLTQEQLVIQSKLAEIKREQDYDVLIESPKNNTHLKTSALETSARLESKQRRFRIEIGELTSSIEQLNLQIATLSKRKSKALIIERDQNKVLLKYKKAALKEVEEELLSRLNKTAEVINSKSALMQDVTVEEESLTAKSKEYKIIQSEYNKVADQNTQIKKIQTDLASKRKELDGLISKNQESQSESITDLLEQRLSEISILNTSLSNLEKARNLSLETFNQNLKNTSNPEVIQNLLLRDVAPIIEVDYTLSRYVFKEFKILPPAEKMIRPKIVLNEEKPKGLFYRVQVGAFAKPINETLFSEFTPVSGEKLNNGITRYMVGYFNNRETAMTALVKVRKIGYADAFPVAYCDGERISMLEAKHLEERGLCLPKGLDQLNIDIDEDVEAPLAQGIVQNRIENKDNSTLEISTVQNVRETKGEGQVVSTTQNNPRLISREIVSSENEKLAAYNKAPGAAIADAVETRLGLFFTVQIGVYNKPVPASQLYNIAPLITQRLENGQVRYSSGVFHSVADSRPKRDEAVVLGITDAYITAYYQGKRISIQEARELLTEKGDAILEPINVIENKILTEDELTVIEAKNTKEEEHQIQKVKNKLDKSSLKVQFISKKQYESFPLDVIKRYNQKGSFFYDVKDQRVKSMIFSASDMPTFYGVNEEMDTLIVSVKTRQEASEELILKVAFIDANLSGAAGDWLIRLGYLKELKVFEDRIQLTIFGVKDPIDYEFLLNDLRSLGFELVREIKE